MHANTSGTLEITTFLIDDVTTGFWKVSTSSSAVLRLDQGFDTFVQGMSGGFEIQTGTLDVEVPGFHTTGDITMAGGTIDVAAGAEGRFRYPIAPVRAKRRRVASRGGTGACGGLRRPASGESPRWGLPEAPSRGILDRL